MGHKSGSPSLNSAELQAVWELAESPGDRVRLLFIEDALRRPETARQLSNRRVCAAHALVGLDRGRRHQVEKVLLARLRDRQVDDRVREDSALIGTALGDPGPQFAQEAARVLVEAMTRTTDPTQLSSLAEALSSLVDRLEPKEAADRAVVIARTLGEEASPPTRLSGLATLLHASQPPPCRLATQELVDLLKMPTCVGSARDVVLRLLGQKCNRHFADQWEFVDYAHEHLPDIDLTSPPKRPQP